MFPLKSSNQVIKIIEINWYSFFKNDAYAIYFHIDLIDPRYVLPILEANIYKKKTFIIKTKHINNGLQRM